jgi:hypothetical protein
MASPAISLNPAVQTNFPGSFALSSEGYTQGDALDDPNNRFNLRKGIVAPAATQPMWGGLAISESLAQGGVGVGATNPAGSLGSILAAAANLTAGTAGFLNGWTVHNQATALIGTAQSRVPQAPSGGAINYYRTGSGARIPVKVLAAAAIEWKAGATVGPQDIYWDTVNLQLTNAAGSGIIGPILNVTIDDVNLANSKVVSYNSGTNLANWLEGQPIVVLKI